MTTFTKHGADAPTYIAHLDRSLRSRVFTPAPNLAHVIGDTLKTVRTRRRWWPARNPVGGACATGSASAAIRQVRTPPVG